MPALVPKEVLYCGECGLPPEYCEFGPNFEKCKPWLIENCPGLYPELGASQAAATTATAASSGAAAPAAPAECREDDVEGGMAQLSVSTPDGDAGEGAPAKGSKAAKEKPAADEDVVRLPGGKVKKKEKPEVVVELTTRNKRKHVTIVKGLDMFGVKLSEASKKFGKKFACGASVVKGPTEKDQIDVQGDFLLEITELIVQTYKEVPASSIFWVEDGKKRPAEI
eukprot:jgi/Mesvir1/1184/Mv17679-RA.1